ncbi:MAG TPA: glycosyltransferase family 4 protein [Acidobacteriota bacterium]|nr:glycosyltransferase family 4 protein [Acidobacteriota bacterium]
MKILISSVHAGRSAGTWYAIETARRLAARGHDIVYLPRPFPEELGRPRDAGLAVIDNLDLEQKGPARAYRNLRRLSRIIAELAPDAVLAYGGEDHAFWGLAKRLWARRRMALIRVRVLDPKAPKRHPLARWLNRSATDAHVTANSRHYQEYQHRLRVPPGKLRIIEAGIDPADFADLSDAAFAANEVTWPADRLAVVMVARFAPIKGYRVLLAAAGKVRRQHPEAHFFFVGYPLDYTKADLERWLVEANLVDAITIIDRRLPQLPALLSRCAVGVVASVGSETVSRSLLEYLASGLPVAATDVGGVPDLLARGAFGRLVPPDNADALAEAIGGLLADDAGRRASGAQGREYVLQNCTWEKRVDQWEDVLARTVANVRGTASSLPTRPGAGS